MDDLANEIISMSITLGRDGEDILHLKARAEKWIEQNISLILCCGISSFYIKSPQPKPVLTLLMINNAVTAASKDIGADLAKVEALKKLIERINFWSDRAAEFAPNRKVNAAIEVSFNRGVKSRNLYC